MTHSRPSGSSDSGDGLDLVRIDAWHYSSPALPWDVINAMATANEQRHATNMKA